MPDEQWEKMKECGDKLDDVYHQPICLHAYNDGYLNRITRVIHAFCIDENGEPKVTKQYEKDLVENWFNKSLTETGAENYLHKRSKGYMGKFFELLFTGFLKDNGFKIIDLEAWNSKSPDIYAEKDGKRYLIECKYIGNSHLIKQGSMYGGVQEIWAYTWCRLHNAFEKLEKHANDKGEKVAVAILCSTNIDGGEIFVRTRLDEIRFDHNNDFAIFHAQSFRFSLIKTRNPNSAFNIQSQSET